MPIKPTAAKSSAPKPTVNKMPPTTTSAEEFADVAMDDDKATREGESSAAVDVDSDTSDAGEEDPYPLGSFPCANCQAVVAKGMLFCLKCKAPQTDESSKVTKKLLKTKVSGFVFSRLLPQGPANRWKTLSAPTSDS